MNVSIIGLGKLGLSMAMAIASKGHRVIGVDIDEGIIRKLKTGQSHISEARVPELLTQTINRGLFEPTQDFSKAVFESDLSFIAVNTPQKPDGNMGLEQAVEAAKKLAQPLKQKKTFHVVAVSSTILPETTDRLLKPILEEETNKTAGKDFGLCVNPVFIALTTVVRDFLNPPAVVIGESDQRSGDLIDQLYTSICENQPKHIRTTLLMAELIKMTHNAYATAKMAFINEIADLCSKVPGADIRALTEFFRAGGERPGKFLEAGLGFGGPCFPRDLEFFTNYVKTKLSESPLLESIQISNRRHAAHLVGLLEDELSSLKNRKVAVLGLSYKPNSDITESSFSLNLIELLVFRGAVVSAYDPAVKECPWKIRGDFKIHKNIPETLKEADACIVATPWDEFKKLRALDFERTMKQTILLDPWRLYERESREAFHRYLPVGIGAVSAELQSLFQKT